METIIPGMAIKVKHRQQVLQTRSTTVDDLAIALPHYLSLGAY